MSKKSNFYVFLISFLFISMTISVYAGSLESSQTDKTVNGTVLDRDGIPLIGVSIMEKGTTNGTITDIDGAFSLKLTQSDPILTFSYIGYIGQDIKVGNQTKFDIILQEHISALDEIVVIGYGTKRKGGVTSAVTTINNQELTRTTSTTVSGAIVGKMAGITARQKSGTPGSPTSIQIRNFGTPLYVIDGIITDDNGASFNNLDVNDIDNISVLKDGAAAIYGIKAANGVVLVTTKGGKKSQKPQVSLNAYTGWQQWTKYPELMDAYEWNFANYMRDVNNGINTFNYRDPSKVDAAKADLEKWEKGYYDPQTGEDYRGYNWKEGYVSDAAPQNYINASIVGGSDKVSYYLSLSHIDQDAVFKDYNFNRTNLQANFDIQLHKNFKIGYQMAGKIENTNNPGLPGSNDYELIATSLFELQPTVRPYANNNPLYLNYTQTNDNSHNMSAYTKDIAGTYEKIWRTTRNNFTFDYTTPLKGLTAKALFSYYYANRSENNNELGWQEYSYDRINNKYNLRYDKTASGNTYRVRDRENMEEMAGQFLLNYDNTFNKKHHVTATGGFEFFERDQNIIHIQQNPVENPFVDIMSTSKSNTASETKKTISTSSFVFRTSYDYMQKYIVDFAGRYDGSWKFPENHRWGFFPSVSGAWRLSEEEFFKNSKISNWLSNVKLRVSYGEMGDDNMGSAYADYAFMPGYDYNKGSAYIPINPITGNADTRVVGTNNRPVPNDQLSWMTVSILDIGIDLGFFNNRLLSEFDVFKRKRDGIAALSSDLIFPLESGMTAMAQNLNSDENVGVDGFIKWVDRAGSVNYFVGVNATLSRQKNGIRQSELFYNAIDQWRWSQNNRWANVSQGQVWMWETIGVFQTQEEIDNYPVNIDGANNVNLVPGDLIFKDINGDGIIDDLDKRPMGYASVDFPWDSSQGNKNPLMSLGFNFGFDWKGIDFAADFAGGFMNTFVPDWYVKWGTSRSVNGYKYNSLNVWRHEDIFDPTSPWIPGDFPAIRTNNPSTRGENDWYTKNVNYLRLRNLVAGYTLPASWTKKAYIQKLRFYFEGSNLFCWDTMGDYGFDPEISTVTGRDYPQHRVYTIGLNLTF